jgi:large subunit ribosomal protein L24
LVEIDGRIVEKLNIVHKHTRPRPVKGTRGAQMTPGGVLQTEAPLRIDNVALLCPSCSKPTRVGYRFTDEGEKTRICRRKDCGKDID